ncbi:hypothetical protein Ndes2526B_g00276 [Nannochloris sp. 'desiccata']|nr:hypothetical protein NADE_002125 [Chlorella desiccata (nom. nud.)]
MTDVNDIAQNELHPSEGATNKLAPEGNALNSDLAKLEKKKSDALLNAADPAACYWYYFTPKMISGKPGDNTNFQR